MIGTLLTSLTPLSFDLFYFNSCPEEPCSEFYSKDSLTPSPLSPQLIYPNSIT
jgi:hypothetical protein